ncbi:(2Fe-2S)-binding protein [Vogesella sp. LIG4]|uniref:(2Fe-2S)-binding protein n=1 Tax=Vogesella sp. LIG4 TaxID=1192162 RepID=UPI00081FAE9C|nr:(2Fe-2S)-binding protein [Vogesella sp. LIG4]SCK20031.1 bacterioferritin-associated ferredoxin [Vogesella sp. LIG4]
MYVCLCHGITDREIRSAVANGATRMSDLAKELGVASECGRCACSANQLRKEVLLQISEPELAAA